MALVSLSDRQKGLMAALTTFSIGVGWHLVTRKGSMMTLAPIDMVLIRFLMPALILSPLILRRGLFRPGLDWRDGLGIFAGAGVPYALVVLTGAGLAPVAHMGALLPGSLPFWVALMAFFLLGERIGRMRKFGLAFTIGGMVLVGWSALSHGQAGSWRGDLLFALGSFMWSFYAIAYRRSKLDPLDTAAFIAGWSALVIVPIWFLAGRGNLAISPWSEIITQAIWQGVCTGILGLWLFGIAIDKLGAGRAAAFGAMVPVLVAVGGWLYLGEPVDLPTGIGCLLASLGVLLSSGLIPDKPVQQDNKPM